MPLGSITYHIDLAQTAITLFFLAFLGLVWFLRRLDKREGYPMKASPFDPEPMLGFPPPPDPETYLLNEGGTTVAPHHYPPPTPGRSRSTPSTARRWCRSATRCCRRSARAPG